jgi:S1-C subfamily serine protease
MISCCTTRPARINNVPPSIYHSFVKIYTEVYAKRCTGESCERAQINAFSGSGVAVLNPQEGTLILTAEHICNRLNQTKSVSNYTISFHMKIIDYRGNSYENIKMIDSQPEHDICLMLIEEGFLPTVPISQQAPRIGEHVYNIAAPLGIFNKGMVPTFDGFYSGNTTSGSSLYTIPVQGGSSGSPIFNDRFQLIGIVHSKFGGIENISLSVSFSILYNFLQKYQNRSSLSEANILNF